MVDHGGYMTKWLQPKPCAMMRHRFSIERNTPTRDDQGGLTDSWAEVATRWGSREPLRGRDLFEANQFGYEATHRVVINYYSAIKPSDRLVCSGLSTTDYIVHIAMPWGIKERQELLVKEQVAA
jgi:SPP1 family predicted phage head-tail adaptor